MKIKTIRIYFFPKTRPVISVKIRQRCCMVKFLFGQVVSKTWSSITWVSKCTRNLAQWLRRWDLGIHDRDKSIYYFHTFELKFSSIPRQCPFHQIFAFWLFDALGLFIYHFISKLKLRGLRQARTFCVTSVEIK